MEDDRVGARLVAVGDVGRCDYDYEGEEVGWCGESLGVDGGVAHVFYDGWEEDRHGAEGNVAAEEHSLTESVGGKGIMMCFLQQ